MKVKNRLLRKLNNSDCHSIDFEFKMLLKGSAYIHLFLLTLTLIFKMYPFALYQLFIIIFYLILAKIWSNKYFILICVLSFFEVTIYIFLISAFLSSTYSSELYLLVLIPAANCVVFTSYSRRVKHLFMILSALYCTAAYFGIKFLVSSICSVSYGEIDFNESFIFIRMAFEVFHIVTAFGSLFITTLFFIKRTYTSFEQLQLEKNELYDIANYDSLTGLYNRRKMKQILHKYIVQWEVLNKPFVIAIGDIDYFKTFNDIYGHQSGDLILQDIGKILLSFLREGDAVCRWGGEEFLFVFQCQEPIALNILERLRKHIEKTPMLLAQEELHITMTFGVSEIQSGQSISELIENADKKLYQGKNNGRNCVIGSSHAKL